MSRDESLNKYISLIKEYVDGKITVSEFESSYLKTFKDEKGLFPEKIYNALNNLFFDVEAYCNDPSLKDDDDINEEQLLLSAQKTLKYIKNDL